MQLFRENFERDLALQYTSKGIHKDDMELMVNSFPIKKEGSQGQQKTFLIALKLAQFDFLQKISRLKPILLLDDLFDKLDMERVELFIRLVAKDGFGQIFITDTNKNRLDEILEKINSGYSLFAVDNGEVKIQRSLK
jgi:DNA replication and repair protein RecF